MTLLAKSEKGGRDYAPRVEGEIPSGMRGSLYRNGPGLFEIGEHRLRHLLDGDGLVQRLSISDGGVRYQNAFVATEKLTDELAAGTRLHATWTTRKPGGALANLGGGGIVSQAGVTVYPVHGKIIARDETGPNYEIDPENLATAGHFQVGEDADNVSFKAHSKRDPETGDWIIAGQQFGPSMKLHVAVYAPDFELKKQFAFSSPRQVYIHDFLVSKHYLLFVLHPCNFSPVSFLAGLKSFTDSLSWDTAAGNVVAVVPRSGGEARYFETPATFMWHGFNAFDAGDEIIADFVGYDAPDHFIGESALFRNIMRGRMGAAKALGKLRRYTLNMRTGAIHAQVLDEANHEYPIVDERAAMSRHKSGFTAVGGTVGFNSGVKRFDFETGKSESFEFSSNVHVGEPVFVPRPGAGIDDGWLIAQCLDGNLKRSFFAVFSAQAVEDGPLAKIWLSHHVPISFHGAWKA